MEDNSIEKNKEWNLAWRIANETDSCLFLTGKAGTGKTTFLRHLKKNSRKRMVVLAPTGIAAINAHGVTIHSFFQMPLSPFIPGGHVVEQQRYKFSKEKLRIIRSLDLIVIDEISMVRADLLDAVDDSLRRLRRRNEPFGGVQVIMIGDLQQLAPVAKEDDWDILKDYYQSTYFFDSKVLQQINYPTIELKKVFRQDDDTFIGILNAIRNGQATQQVLDLLNKRYLPNFQPTTDEGYIRLTTHNALVQRVNDRELNKLDGKEFTYTATTEGDFPDYSYPTDEQLTLKRGAQVMFIKNDTSAEHQFYNGMIGSVCDINENGFCVRAKDSGEIIDVERETWQNCKYSINDVSKEISEEVVGTFCQFPVRLAWAITIHKSQGLTFSHAMIDVQASFAHGQTYVALSRCKSLDGLVLSSPVTQKAIISDHSVDDFNEKALSNSPGEQELLTMKERYLLNLISELFNFSQIKLAANSFVRVLDEHLYKQYPNMLAEWKLMMTDFDEKVVKVAENFKKQYSQLALAGRPAATGCVGEQLQERITKGAAYFKQQLAQLKNLFMRSDLLIANKQIQKQATNATELLTESLKLKLCMLAWAAELPFTVENYLDFKAALLLGRQPKKEKQKRERASRKQAKQTVVTDEIHDKQLYDRLAKWRNTQADKENLPSYCVFNNATLAGIANTKPQNENELLNIPGIGERKIKKYGTMVLDIVKE